MSLPGVARPRLAQLAEAGAALLAVALLGAVVAVALADADAALARRAEEQHVGDADRHLLGEPAALGVAAVGLEVLVHPVDALDQHAVLVGENAEHAAGAALLGVVAGDHFHHVVFADVHRSTLAGPARRLNYTTSAARLMILVKPRSRSSRATAPKMRVPRGFFSASMMTMALRSKRT